MIMLFCSVLFCFQFFNFALGMILLHFVLLPNDQARERTKESLSSAHYKAAEYDSNKEFRDSGKRLEYNPNEKFINPVTSSQTYGWKEDTEFARLDKIITKRYPKTASPETRFADAMAADNL